MRSIAVFVSLAAAAALMALSSTAAVAGPCEPDGVHAAAVAAAREQIRHTCPCQGGTDTHARYLQCVGRALDALTERGELPAACKGKVRSFAARSPCGRAGVITCCIKTPRSRWLAVLRKSEPGCRPARGGEACVAYYEHLDDACLPDQGCWYNRCGDGIIGPLSGEQCEPPGTATCDSSCHTITCGNGVVDANEECEPPGTATCTDQCRTRWCGNGTLDPGEECDPPGTATCTDRCLTNRCGNGVVEGQYDEQCEPPNTATCDAICRFVHTCGNGVIELGEECDGQPGCTGCTLNRSLCCEIGDNGCVEQPLSGGLDAYFFMKNCVLTLGGTSSYGICTGPPCAPPIPPDLGCHLGPCADQPIDPLPLCCQRASGGCSAIVATSTGALGFCTNLLPPEEGDVDRVMIGTCGDDGRCQPAN